MNYYKRHLGDYAKKAARLSILQHGVYNLLIDACYDRERFPTKEEAIEWTWACTQDEKDAVDFVLKKFFIETSDGHFEQKRIREEIESFHSKSETNKRIADERESNRKKNKTTGTQIVNDASPALHESPPNQEPVTSNQEPVTTTSDGASASPKTLAGKAPKLSDEEWLATLPGLYPHVNIPIELKKLDAWLSCRRHLDKSRKRIVAWMNRIEPPIKVNQLSYEPQHRADKRSREFPETINVRELE